jgi:hypothetical protein
VERVGLLKVHQHGTLQGELQVLKPGWLSVRRVQSGWYEYSVTPKISRAGCPIAGERDHLEEEEIGAQRAAAGRLWCARVHKGRLRVPAGSAARVRSVRPAKRGKTVFLERLLRNFVAGNGENSVTYERVGMWRVSLRAGAGTLLTSAVGAGESGAVLACLASVRQEAT